MERERRKGGGDQDMERERRERGGKMADGGKHDGANIKIQRRVMS